MRIRYVFIALSVLIAQPAVSQRPDTSLAAQTGTPVSYVLRPGDIVRLRIWREPDLSGDYPVDEQGRVNFPLVGTFEVMQESRESLQSRLIAAYKASVQNLSMDVIFLRRLAVVGAVRTPGLYPIEPTMTVGDAVSLAGGATKSSDRMKIHLLRSGKVFMSDIDAATMVAVLPTRPGDQLYVPDQESFFERNPFVLGTAIQAVVTLAVALITLNR
jgi:protein involved in polysaccharide export with SLBB domain